MTVKELIEKLKELPENDVILIKVDTKQGFRNIERLINQKGTNNSFIYTQA